MKKKYKWSLIRLLVIVLAAYFIAGGLKNSAFLASPVTAMSANRKETEKEDGGSVYEKTVRDYSDFVDAVYQGLLKRHQQIRIYYKGQDYKEIHDTFLDEILKEEILTRDDPDTSDDFDYMKYNLISIKIETSSGGFWFLPARIDLTVSWQESGQELKEVNRETKKILDSLKLDGKNTYQKAKAIHSYILDRVEYDHTLTHFTSYDALFGDGATCQGYMLLTYKLFTEAGIPCRCIDGAGLSDGQQDSHGWNIAKLGNWWYYVDATWDDAGIPDLFFLKGEETFSPTHIPMDEFLTPEFLEAYPISQGDFDSEEMGLEADHNGDGKQKTARDEADETGEESAVGNESLQGDQGMGSEEKLGDRDVGNHLREKFNRAVYTAAEFIMRYDWECFTAFVFFVLFVKIIRWIRRRFM